MTNLKPYSSATIEHIAIVREALGKDPKTTPKEMAYSHGWSYDRACALFREVRGGKKWVAPIEHPTREEVLSLLSKRPYTLRELSEHFKIGASTLGSRLSKFKISLKAYRA